MPFTGYSLPSSLASQLVPVGVDMLSPSPALFQVLVSPAASSLTFWTRQEPEIALEPAGPLETRVNLTSDLTGWLPSAGKLVAEMVRIFPSRDTAPVCSH